MNLIVQGLGALLVLVVLVDVFSTVLSATESRGPIERWLSPLMWRSFRAVGQALHAQRTLATLCGPLVIVATLVVWSGCLVTGFGLVYWPLLGGGINSSGGSPLYSLGAALYFSGFTLTTLGTGDLYPVSGFVRFLSILEAWLGFTMLTLTVSYVLSVYNAVRERNRLATTLDALTARSGRSQELFSRLQDDRVGYLILNQLREAFVQLLTAHRQYPVIHYFMIPPAKYSIVRIFFLALDYVALRRAVGQEVDASFSSFEAVTDESLSGFTEMILGNVRPPEAEAEENRDWVEHFKASIELARERAAIGVEAAPDFGRYYEARRQWNEQLRALAAYFAGDWDELTQPAAKR